jgi:CBS domain-containing protein
MNKTAQNVMTPDPACCTPDTPLEDVARLMVRHDCGEIPVVDHPATRRPVGVVTDRDIVCRMVADGRNPIAYAAESCMSQPVVTVRKDASLDEILDTLEQHRIRRVLVVDDEGACVGIIAQADVAAEAPGKQVAELVREVSRHTGQPSH